MGEFAVYDAEAVRRRLDYRGCLAAVRTAMAGFSQDGADQPLRQIVELAPARLFGLMPGALAGADAPFGAKLLSVFGDPDRPGRSAHRGLVALFDRADGAVACVADAGAVTLIRTACASAVATDTLARADARSLAILGCGAQAESHVHALALVRDFSDVTVWGRDPARATAFATRMAADTGRAIRAVEDAREAAAADVVCTVTGAAEPVLRGAWLRPGAHVNLVGSSHAGPVEVDDALVAASRFYVDSRRSALAAAAEFLRAKAAGLIGDDHIAGEIGEVLIGRVAGRTADHEITVYKSLGHIVQDLAATAYLHERNG